MRGPDAMQESLFTVAKLDDFVPIIVAGDDVSAKAVIIYRIYRSTSSDSAVIIRRKPRSRSIGIHSRSYRYDIKP